MQITSVAVFLKEGKVLLEKRDIKEDNYAGVLSLPGGHKRKSETIEKTLAREMKEELKTKIIRYRHIGKFKDIDPTSKKIYVHNAFLCLEWKGMPAGKTARWFKISAVLGGDGKFRNVDKRILKKAGLQRKV